MTTLFISGAKSVFQIGHEDGIFILDQSRSFYMQSF